MNAVEPQSTPPTDLASWLLEQIAEDERVAEAVVDDLAAGCQDHEPWDAHPGGVPCPTGWKTGNFEHNILSDPSSKFMESRSPEDALAECAAKRWIIKSLELFGHLDLDDIYAEEILGVLAYPYADRPGWRDEWAVE